MAQTPRAIRVAAGERVNPQRPRAHNAPGMNYQSLVESAPDAVVVSDESGQILLVNAQTEKLFGFAREELIGRPVETLVPHRYRARHPEFRKKYHDAPHARPMGSGMELYGLRKDGQEFPVEISLNVLDDADGRLVSAAIRDVTAQKRAAEELKRANETLTRQAEELEKSNIELQHFAYIVSHDLQTPLRSICGFVQLLDQEYGDKLDDRAAEWIRRTVLSTQRMQTLIRDILAYSRVDSNVHPFAKLSLAGVLDEVVDLLGDSIRESGAVVIGDDLPEVLGDRPQMVQLLQNLIGNAIKYRRDEPPRVEVFVTETDREWIVTVRDNGMGIPPEHSQRIFDVFQRLHTQQAIPGTGIGLAICRRVVQRHGGRLWVESVPGAGSTFRFSIPREDE